VILTVYDWGEPGSNLAQKQPDEIGFVILDNKGTIIHSTNVYNNNNGLYPIAVQYLDGGNIQVHANPTNLENKSAEIASAGLTESTPLKVYPNPFSDKVVFEFAAGEDTRAVVEITNILGQKIATLMDEHVAKGVVNRVEYAPADVAPGILIYRLILNNGVQSGRIIYKP
jgi:hypothetical protein